MAALDVDAAEQAIELELDRAVASRALDLRRHAPAPAAHGVGDEYDASARHGARPDRQSAP